MDLRARIQIFLRTIKIFPSYILPSFKQVSPNSVHEAVAKLTAVADDESLECTR